MSNATNWDLRAICKRNKWLRIQKRQIREEGSVTSHMIKGTWVKDPGSKRRGLRDFIIVTD